MKKAKGFDMKDWDLYVLVGMMSFVVVDIVFNNGNIMARVFWVTLELLERIG